MSSACRSGMSQFQQFQQMATSEEGSAGGPRFGQSSVWASGQQHRIFWDRCFFFFPAWIIQWGHLRAFVESSRDVYLGLDGARLHGILWHSGQHDCINLGATVIVRPVDEPTVCHKLQELKEPRNWFEIQSTKLAQNSKRSIWSSGGLAEAATDGVAVSTKLRNLKLRPLVHVSDHHCPKMRYTRSTPKIPWLTLVNHG